MDLNLECKQSLNLDLLYPESHEMFLVLSLTEWDTFLFSFCLAEKIIIICRFHNLFFECLILKYAINVDVSKDKVLFDMDCSFLLKMR